MGLKTRRFAQRAREIAASLRGLERLAGMLGAASLVRALLEGVSVTLLVPFLEAFRPGAESRLRFIAIGIGALVLLRAGASYLSSILSAQLQVRVLVRLRE